MRLPTLATLAPNPSLQRVRQLFFVFSGNVLLDVFMGTLQLLTSQYYFASISFATGIFCLIIGCCQYGYLRFLQRIERYRFMSIADESRELIATMQVPSVLPPPSIDLRLNKLSLFLCAGLAWSDVALLLWPGVPRSMLDILSFTSATMAILGLLIVILSIIIIPRLLFLRASVEATELGLIAKNKHMVPWEEARLFACYRMPGLLKTVVIYEVSSANQVASWRWVLDAASPLSMWHPVLPVEEYHQQMRQLRAFVSAKTGLQLHDLSERRKQG